MAEIAAALNDALTLRERTGQRGRTMPREVAHGNGWAVADVLCTCGPRDRAYEEQHVEFAVALVVAGSFQHRGSAGRALMTPGSAMLGNAGACFQCGHDHGSGDRCVSFWYSPEYFARVAADAGVSGAASRFAVPALPPLRTTAALVSRASAALLGSDTSSWNELAVDVAASALQLASGDSRLRVRTSRRAEALVASTVRFIDEHLDRQLTLDELADVAGLSPFHFLRTFEAAAGITPYQFVRRSRLRLAATRLLVERSRIIDIALDSGFGDVSNFNRAFRSEFGMSPRRYRRRPAHLIDPVT